MSLTTKKPIDILKSINFLRREMIRIGIEEGLSSQNTVSISQLLDLYISAYQSNK